MVAIDKKQLLTLLIQQLSDELARSRAQALSAAEGATHEDNRAEGDKDMRATEASYIARGYAERAGKLEQAVALLSRLDLAHPKSAIQSSALVELEHDAQRAWYFLVPAAGGEHLSLAGQAIQTLTPTSPLGRALLGLNEGDEVDVETPQGVRSYTVLRVE